MTSIAAIIETAKSKRTGSLLSSHSKRTYKNAFRSINVSEIKELKDVKKITSKIKEKKSLNTQKGIYTAVLTILRNKPEYKDIHSEYNRIVKNLSKEIKSNVGSTFKRNESENFLEKKELIKILDSEIKLFKDKDSKYRKRKWNKTNVRKLLLFCLFSGKFPVRRGSEWLRVKVLDRANDTKDDDYSYLHPDGKIVIGRNVAKNKVKSTNPRKEIKLHQECVDIIKVFIKLHKNPLMLDLSVRDNISSRVSKMFNFFTGKKININLARKIDATFSFTVEERKIVKRAIKRALLADHSVQQELDTYILEVQKEIKSKTEVKVVSDSKVQTRSETKKIKMNIIEKIEKFCEKYKSKLKPSMLNIFTLLCENDEGMSEAELEQRFGYLKTLAGLLD